MVSKPSSSSSKSIMENSSSTQWSAIATLVSIKLNRDNYLLWSSQLELVMESQELVQFIDEMFPTPPETIVKDGKIEVNKEFDVWKRIDGGTDVEFATSLSDRLRCSRGEVMAEVSAIGRAALSTWVPRRTGDGMTGVIVAERLVEGNREPSKSVEGSPEIQCNSLCHQGAAEMDPRLCRHDAGAGAHPNSQTRVGCG
ncbi:hypothetical protein EJ110_NYTH14688 [Nymphaea thermarum]|nr:hypothetical protein EJ110_NYTH14688 [Nymphaea thermarum]